MKKNIRKLKFKNKTFVYDENNRLIVSQDGHESETKLKDFYGKEEDMPQELLDLIEETIEEMCAKEYLETKKGSAEEADDTD